MLRRLLLTSALVVGLLVPEAPHAQTDLATLVADQVAIAGDDTLVAEGNVEIFHQGSRLTASRILYDRATDRLTIDGPIVLTDGTGTLIVADQANLSADLTEGVLQSARLVLNQQLQLSTAEMERVSGRFTRLGPSVASSCKICAHNPTPLWEIRAARIVHDQQERQIYFDRAQLRFGGVPVFFLPRLRMPDPTLKRSRGFLRPLLLSTSALGTGLKVPYFIPLGESRDLTVTPYLSTKSGRTLELRYRQAFNSGMIDALGAVTRDNILPGQTRYLGIVTGTFALPRDFTLSFRAETVSDPAYLVDYGLTSKSWLVSDVQITRTRRDEYISGRMIHYNSLQSGSANSSLPLVVGDLTWQRRFSPVLIGGEGVLRLQSHGHYRRSDNPLDLDGDGISNGRDLGRVSLAADWRRNYILPGGILAATLAEVRGDFYSIKQDAVFGGSTFRGTGAAAMELRWPWVNATSGGASHVIEPVVQLVFSPNSSRRIPNEDSVIVEFDEGNLFSLGRFPGADAVEGGNRANLGFSYTRFDPAGWSMGMTLGRVFRLSDFGQFGVSSGLSGRDSDWLAALHIATSDGLTLTNRLVFDTGLSMTKAEMRLDLQRERYGVNASYAWVLPDPLESRPNRISELVVDGRYQMTPNWLGRVATRYDFEVDRAASAGLNLEYRTECIKVDVSLSRRFTSSAQLRPVTNFGLSVDLLGFGGSARPGPARACRG